MTSFRSSSAGSVRPRAVDPAASWQVLADRGSQYALRAALRVFLAAYSAALALAKLLGGRPRPVGPRGADVLLTGTFHSENWIASHLQPLARSLHCRRIRVVTLSPLPAIDKVEMVSPPPWLVSLAGRVSACLLAFVWSGFRERADIVGAFHLLMNGLVAALLARLTASRGLYFCVGGRAEVLDGGLLSENRIFQRLERPDSIIERRLLGAVGAFPLIITMGTKAASFFRARGVATACHVVPGGFDIQRFSARESPPDTDLILVARLAPIKRVDLFLDVVARMKAVRPRVTAMVVGDGPLRDDLQGQARRLGLEENVTFVGHQSDVETWLRKARVFVLTSQTESLALAMTEAMLCGLPAVVSDVGDLSDLVEHGVNGYLVAERSPDAFAIPLLALLGDEARRAIFGRAARRAAERHEMTATTASWDAILGPMITDRTPPSSAPDSPAEAVASAGTRPLTSSTSCRERLS